MQNYNSIRALRTRCGYLSSTLPRKCLGEIRIWLLWKNINDKLFCVELGEGKIFLKEKKTKNRIYHLYITIL